MITRRQFVLGLGTAAAASGLGGYAFALEPRFRLIVTERDLTVVTLRCSASDNLT